MCGGVGVELDVRGGGAALLRRLPMRFGRCIRRRIRGLALLQVAVDVTREVAPVHTARHVAELTATFDAVAAGVPEPPPIGPHAPATSSTAIAVRDARMPPTVRDGIRGQSSLSDVGRTWDGNVATCRRPRYAPRLAGRGL